MILEWHRRQVELGSLPRSIQLEPVLSVVESEKPELSPEVV
jgi:hypothetical protein